MRQATNTPYVKRYHTVDGIVECGNPITKTEPYLNDGSNRQNRKMYSGRHRSNKKGISLIIHKEVMRDENGNFVIMISKVKKFFQTIKANSVLKTIGKGWKKNVEEINYPARTIEHSELIR